MSLGLVICCDDEFLSSLKSNLKDAGPKFIGMAMSKHGFSGMYEIGLIMNWIYEPLVNVEWIEYEIHVLIRGSYSNC